MPPFPFMNQGGDNNGGQMTDSGGFPINQGAGGDGDLLNGGDGGGFGDDLGNDDGGGQQQDRRRQQSSQGDDDAGDDEPTDDDLLAELWAEDEDAGASGGNQQPGKGGQQQQPQDENSPEAMTALQTQLNKEINDAINGMALDENVIPEDFNPADSKQIRAVMVTAMKQSAMMAIRLSMRPMQVAIDRLGKVSQAYINQQVTQLRDSMKTNDVFSELVPEVNDPILKSVVTTLDSKLKTKGKNVRERARLIRKALDGMGIKGTQQPANQNNRQQGQQPTRRRQQQNQPTGFNTGAAALDIFAPLPKQRQGR